MRFAISILAALMILGLAAFGVVSAEKMSAPPSQTATADSAAATPQAAPARRHPVNPVSQIAQTAGEPAPTPTPAAAPVRMAEATQAAAPAAPSQPPARVAPATPAAAPAAASPPPTQQAD